MDKYTPAYSVVAFLLVAGSTLMAQPSSVFSQDTTLDTVDERVESEVIGVTSTSETEVTSQPVVTSTQTPTDPYRREKLIGDRVYNDFVVGPGKFEIEIAPGETQVVELQISNRLGRDRIFTLSTEDTTANEEGTALLLGDEVGPYTLKDYISVPTEQFLLESNTRARIPVTISLPEDAEPGGRYGSILVSVVMQEATRTEDGGAVPGSAVVSRIGSLFYVTTPGDLNTEGQLQDFATVNNKKIYSKGPVSFNVAFENTGTVHLTPSGRLEITNLLGDVVGQSDISPWFVLPQSVRNRAIDWNREFLLGRYTASVVIDRDYDGLVDEMSYSFWVIPWQFITSLLGGLFIIFLLLRFFFSRFEFKRK